MNDKVINLALSVDQTNLVLEALGQLPFVKVYDLIASLQNQAKQQLQTPPAAEPSAVPTIVEAATGE